MRDVESDIPEMKNASKLRVKEKLQAGEFGDGNSKQS